MQVTGEMAGEARADEAAAVATPAPRVGVLLSGGASRRMGRPKALLVDQAGRLFLERLVGTLRAGGCDAVVVVAGCHVAEIAARLPPEALLVRNAAWERGQFSSVRCGLEAALCLRPRRIAFTLIDQPLIVPADVRAVLRAEVEAAPLAIAAHGGEPGHPLSLSPALARAIASDERSTSLREALERHADAQVFVEGSAGCVRGANTPEELVALGLSAALLDG